MLGSQMRSLTLVSFGALVLAACDSGPNVSMAEQNPSPTPTVTPVVPPSPWNVSSERNELTGVIDITAINGYGDQNIVIRRKAGKLELFLTTGKFLETTENMYNRLSRVRYKFDDGAIMQQEWEISSTNNALFYPGDPSAFLQRMSKAQKFVIEYQPADYVAETATFDVSQFPSEFRSKASK